MNEETETTIEEDKAIKSLQRVAKKWPKSLWLFSASGSLCVMKKNSEGEQAITSGYDLSSDAGVDPDYIVGHIDIENDGGDW